jgi:hypothetical protein
MHRPLLLVPAIVLIGTLWTATASAQIPRYTPPAGGTLPSQLNFFRFDVGVLDNYNGIVAPARNLNNQLQNMTAREQSDFRSTQREISQVRSSEAAPTGVGAGFMNYSHYYRLSTGGAARGGGRTGRYSK